LLLLRVALPLGRLSASSAGGIANRLQMGDDQELQVFCATID
jgi:hypothetical protein